MNVILRVGLLFILGVMLAIAPSSISAQTPYADSTPANTGIPNRIQQIERTWQQQYENYFQDGSTGTTLTAEEINETLQRLGNQTAKNLALIYVFPHPDELELVLVVPGSEPIRKTFSDVPQERLLAVINTYKSQIIRSVVGRRYLAASQQLYQWIVTPLENELESHRIDTLIFCVGADLRSTPIAALHNGQNFLVEKYNLGLIPAFTLINHNYESIKNTSILAMGASQFQQLASLPAVPVELSAITQSGWEGDVFLNQDFTLNNLRQQLESGQFGIVHLATHAQFQAGSPDQSYIQFWQNDQLKLNQLRQFDWSQLPVELLVLSACQTALGDRNAELGFAGLAFQSGVKSSLASLWRVNDVGTLALMREFYWQLSRPDVTTKSEAIRRAQLAMQRGDIYIENNRLHTSGGVLLLPEEVGKYSSFNFVSPYYWAAFTLVGSPW